MAAHEPESQPEGKVESSEKARAFEVVVQRHWSSIFRLCQRILNHREEAEDATQQTFVNAWQSRQWPRDAEGWSRWLRHIAVNECRQSLRRCRRQQAALENYADLWPGEADAYRRRELADCAQAVLQRLGPDHRLVLILRYFEELSYGEIADALGWSMAKVKVTLHRAKESFKEALEEEEPL